MERDDPTRNRGAFSGREDILSVNDSSDIEMTSVVDVPAHPSGDSALVTGSEDEGKAPANDPGSSVHPDSNPESNSGNEESPSGSNSGSSADSPGSDNDDKFGDMFSPGGTLQPIKRKPESRAQSNSHSQSRESEPHKLTLMPSPENEPNPDKPEQKKKKLSSGKSGTPKGVPIPNPEAIDKMAQDIGEELIQSFQEKDSQDHRSQSKKTKKDSDREAEKVARGKIQEEEERKRKKKKKREKEAKERKEKEEQEAKKRAEEEQLASDKRLAQAKLIHTAWLEKYGEELPELKRYWKKFISNIQQTTINLDSHTRYLELVMEDKSLYPNQNVILATQWIQRLRDKKRDDLVDRFLAVVDKGFGSHLPQGFPQPDDPVMKPLYFVRCLMRSDGTVIDTSDKNYGDDQNISLHDLTSQPSMWCLTTSWKITVNSHRLLTLIDTGFCPFCNYHSSCHKMLNNHVRIDLSLLLFCGFLGCFYTSSDCKAMFQHAITHPEYEKSKELYPKDG